MKYTKDQQRVADYIVRIAGMGGGSDPVGFLIASHESLRDRLKRLESAQISCDALYAIARRVTLKAGMDWYDPRSGKKHSPPKLRVPAFMSRARARSIRLREKKG